MRRTTARTLVLFLVAWTLASRAPTAARAQVPPIRVTTVALLNASPTSFVANKDLRVDFDRTSLTSTASLQVRVFRGTKSELPGLGRDTPDGCLEYDTSLYRPGYSPGQMFVTQTNRSWLSPRGDRAYASAQFVLVFELGGPRETRIKIARRDAVTYFSRGLEIEITPDAYLPDRVAQEIQQSQRRYERYVQRIATDPRGCLEVVDNRQALLTMDLVSCGERELGRDSRP